MLAIVGLLTISIGSYGVEFGGFESQAELDSFNNARDRMRFYRLPVNNGTHDNIFKVLKQDKGLDKQFGGISSNADCESYEESFF
jgi:hypothetical protein